ncbi:NAD(P)/FAD-dependent oxidoreductase [Nonomuraea wenchangensis]|uniref:Glycine/D-amino acid oxidase n=1 Tax=Nonomuraea wenchangensis TaxID=568860 RepID=A0A1I0H007_9ACTN|nr:FAD-binding oxidoreductase [Nonomuraea wenchangensis]SET76112.1 Glycine/D-amino acid oxidase [Nonomuraea wenchangensis]
MPEVIVVGAGVMGASTAFHLAERGARSVTVVDARHAGEGMSSRSSALVRMHYTYEQEVRLAVDSLAFFREWPERVGRPPVLRECGFVRVVQPGEADLLRKNVEMQRACGAEAEVIGAADVLELEPGWRVDDVVAAAYEPRAGYGDGAVVAGDFLSRARELGVAYRPNTPVRSLLTDAGGRVRGVRTAAGDLMADLVVLAAGVWTRPLLLAVGVDLPIEPEYHEVAVLRDGPGGPASRIACIDSGTRTYFRPEGGGLLLGDFIGPRDGIDSDDFPQTPGEESVVELVGRAARRVPALAESGISRGVTGVYDMSPDARPMLGPVAGIEGLIVAAGFSGMGFKICPAVGRALAELALGEPHTVDISPFTPDRFAQGRPIDPPYGYGDD